MSNIETTLHNLTTIEIDLKAGNHSIFRTIARIKPKDTYLVRSSSNETYKEYWCAMQAHEEKIILSSDDCMEWKEIAIKPNDDNPNKFWWVGTLPRDSKPGDSGNSGTESASGLLASAKRVLGRIFFRNKSHTTSDTRVQSNLPA